MNNDNSKRIEIFSSYPIPKAFISLAVPTIITQIITIIYNYADAWFVGRTNDANAVAAMAVVMPVYVILAALANLFGVGGSSTIARFLGLKEENNARKTFVFALWGGICAAVLYALFMFCLKSKIIYMVGGNADTYAYIYDYIFITIIIGAVPTILNNLFGHLVRSVGAAKEASLGMSIGAILNIILDPIFMFVILPKGNEVKGAAIATLLANCVSMTYFIIYILKHKEIKVFTLNPKNIVFKKNIVQNVIFIGLPAALGTSLAMVSNIAANKLMSSYNNFAVAGIGTAKRANTLAFNICMGITQGMLPFIAFNFAAKNYDRMKKGIIYMFKVALTFSAIVLVLFIVFAKQFIAFFINDAETIAYGTSFLRILAIAVPLCAISYSINTIFQATGQKIYSFFVSILRKGGLDIPFMIILKAILDNYNKGALGIVLATPCAEIISVLIAVAMLLHFIKKLKNNTQQIENSMD